MARPTLAVDLEIRARASRVEALLRAVCDEDELPWFVSDEASLYDVCSLETEEKRRVGRARGLRAPRGWGGGVGGPCPSRVARVTGGREGRERFRQKSTLAANVLVQRNLADPGTMLAACPNPTPSTEGAASDPTCAGCYTTIYDNPIEQSSIVLGSFTSNGQTFAESASYQSDNYAYYNNFTLQMTVAGANDAQGSVSHARFGFGTPPLPMFPFAMDVNNASGGSGTFSSGDTMVWAAYGLEMGYDFATITGLNTDPLGITTNTPSIPEVVRLDPATMLVPIQVIRVLPSYADTNYPQLSTITQRAYKQQWDQVPVASVLPAIGSLINQSENDTGNAFLGVWKRADDVWRICGIQFRMINCSGSKGLGCPDLLVSNDSLLNPSVFNSMACEFGDWHTSTSLVYAARMTPGINPELPVVLYTWSLAGTGCAGAGSGGNPISRTPSLGAVVMSVAPSITGSAPYPLAHEMGLMLGLGEDPSCTPSSPRLMCENVAFQNATITANECSYARQGAAGYVHTQWGVTVKP